MKTSTLMVTLMVVVVLCGSVMAGEEAKKLTPAEKTEALKTELNKAIDADKLASPALKKFVKEQLVPLSVNPTFAKTTADQNAKKVSLDEIKKIDKEWIAAEDILPIQEKLLSNACAKEITKVTKVLKVVSEAFVMDNQGATVGENAMTSDYWQGDEAKWKNSFNGGKGGVDVGKTKLDKSTDKVLQQVSLPIIDATGTVIGAVTYGVNVSSFTKVVSK